MKNTFKAAANFSMKMAGCMFVLLAIPCVQGLGAQVDQENWDANPTSIFSVVQQEFTPTLDSLDPVQLLLSNPALEPALNAAMAIRLRV